jgi:hypothetical protein
MTRAFTIISARFARPLSAGEDSGPRPERAVLTLAGTEVDWQDTGQPRRRRDIRTWIAVWPDLDSARAHLATRLDRIPLLSEAVESWAGLMQPCATHGTANWAQDGQMTGVFPDLGPRPEAGRPVFVMTTLGIGRQGEGMIAFGKGVRAVRAAFATHPAVILEQQLLPDLPMIDAPTLSLWRSTGDVVAAAYRSEPHRGAMQIAEHPDLARGSFTRMMPLAIEGNWNGVDLSGLA